MAEIWRSSALLSAAHRSIVSSASSLGTLFSGWSFDGLDSCSPLVRPAVHRRLGNERLRRFCSPAGLFAHFCRPKSDQGRLALLLLQLRRMHPARLTALTRSLARRSIDGLDSNERLQRFCPPAGLF